MALALYGPSTKYGLMALMLLSLLTTLSFYFSDTFRLSDLQNFHRHNNETVQDGYREPPISKPAVVIGSEAHNSMSDGSLKDIRNSTLGFQKIYVLSMPTRSDKRDVMALAAHLTGLDIEFVDGVNGSNIPIVARPDGWEDVFSFDAGNPDANLGCWRGHMDIYQKMVRENIQTAMIIEDDVDWDVMIKSQMTEIARGSKALAHKSDQPSHSPYGDDWWLISTGNCASRDNFDGDQERWIIRNDTTVVPQKHRHMIFEPYTKPGVLAGAYTRHLFDMRSVICTGSYGITLQAASYMIYDQTMLPHARTIDFALSDFCEREEGRCLGVYPPITGIYVPAGDNAKSSDRTERTGRNENAWSLHLVYSVQLNVERLLKGIKTIPSQIPEDSLQKEINLLSHVYPSGKLVSLPASEYTEVYAEEVERRRKDAIWRAERKETFRKAAEEKKKKKEDEEKKRKEEEENKKKEEVRKQAEGKKESENDTHP